MPLDAVRREGVPREGVRGEPDVAALANRDSNQLSVLAWHYPDDDLPGPDADVQLDVKGFPMEIAKVQLQHFRIDDQHSNAYAAWKRMGTPATPTAERYAQREEAGPLAAMNEPVSLDMHEGRLQIGFQLPRQAVSLLILSW